MGVKVTVWATGSNVTVPLTAFPTPLTARPSRFASLSFASRSATAMTTDPFSGAVAASAPATGATSRSSISPFWSLSFPSLISGAPGKIVASASSASPG